MRIAHISDLHICTSNKKTNIKNFKALLTYICNMNYDHIVITGDLTHTADPKDFKIIRNILNSFGLLDTLKLSLVIGNHDIFGGIHYAEDLMSFPQKCRNTDYNKKIKQFGKYFHEVFEKTYCPNGKIFPYAKDLGDVVIIGINSIDQYSKLKNPFASNGRVSKKELSGLIEILSINEYKGKDKIVLIHHHFEKNIFNNANNSIWNRVEAHTMKLRGKKKLIKIFKENQIAAILHGHVHTISDYEKNNVRFLNAGGSIEGGNFQNLRFNEIYLDHGIKNITSHTIPGGNSLIFPIRNFSAKAAYK